MKNLLFILSISILSFNNMAQSPGYDDLKILYADADYEKLVKVADKYTLSDKTGKDILPYFWAAKGLYKLSLSGTDDEAFKNAYKDAIKYLSKGMGYDVKYNDGATIAEEMEFVEIFQMSLVEVIENEMASGGFKKAFGWAIKYQKITLDEVGVKFMMGACKHEDGDKPGARVEWQAGQKLMTEITSIEDWTEADRKMLKLGVLYSAAAMKKSRQMDGAKDLLGKAAQWFENDEDWKEKYDEIVN